MFVTLILRTLRFSTRFYLTPIIVIAVAFTSLMFCYGYIEGSLRLAREATIHRMDAHAQIENRQQKSIRHPGSLITAPFEDGASLVRRLSQLPGIANVFPRTYFLALVSKGEGLPILGTGMSVVPENESEFFSLKAMEGVSAKAFDEKAMIRGNSLRGDLHEVILGRRLAAALEVDIGDTVNLLVYGVGGQLSGVEAVVCGTIGFARKDADASFFKVSDFTARHLFGDDFFTHISLALTEGGPDQFPDSWTRVERSMNSTFPEASQWRIRTFEAMHKDTYLSTKNWLSQMQWLFLAVAALLVFAGVFNVGLTNQLQRTRVFGNLLANGVRKRELGALILLETALTSILGLAVGLLLLMIAKYIVFPDGLPLASAPGVEKNSRVLIDTTPLGWALTIATIQAAALISILASGLLILRRSPGQLLREEI